MREHSHHSSVWCAGVLSCMLRWNIVWMCPIGEFGGERKHPRAKRRDYRQGRLGGWWCRIQSCPHCLQITPHGRNWLAIHVTAQGIDRWRMRYPDTEQEATIRLLVQAALGAGHRH